MTYEEQIAAEQSVITALRNQLKNIKFPARTVNWQHQNIGSTRGGVQQRIEVKRQKLKIRTDITTSTNKIISLREALFGW